MCWLSKKTHGWWKIFAKCHNGYSPLLRVIGALMLRFCWYELRHTPTAKSGANVAWRVWIRKAKPNTAKGLFNNLAIIFIGKLAQVKRKRASRRATPPNKKPKLQRFIYHEQKKWSKKLSENVRIHHRQVQASTTHIFHVQYFPQPTNWSLYEPLPHCA